MEIPSQCVKASCSLSVYVKHWLQNGFVISSSESTVLKQGGRIITRPCLVCGNDIRKGSADVARVAFVQRGSSVMFTPTA